MPESRHQIVLNTCPDRDTATALAEALVNGGLAACVNIVPAVESVYRWQGKIQHDEELLLIIKARNDRFDAISQLIRDRHPYELPEIIAVPINTGLSDYLAWIDNPE